MSKRKPPLVAARILLDSVVPRAAKHPLPLEGCSGSHSLGHGFSSRPWVAVSAPPHQCDLADGAAAFQLRVRLAQGFGVDWAEGLAQGGAQRAGEIGRAHV